jgi:LysM domain
MTERGLPIADGAPACPFVAFDDDRDERGTSPDHRHRCYAEPQPAPRALAHQEAYCLSSAFPVCPTFQDWARREAARARGEAAKAADSEGAGARMPSRNPPRSWAAPPPWLSDGDGDENDADWRERDRDDAGDVGPDVPRRGRGLSGSYADRVASDSPEAMPDDLDDDDLEAPVDADPAPRVPHHRAAGWDDDGRAEDAPAPRPRRRERSDAAIAAPVQAAPEWERARPLEAYPTLRSRRLPELTLPPMLVAVVAIALAAAVLFALPGLLGFGNPSAESSASPTIPVVTAVPSFEPTPVPQPTPRIYVVQAGDTLSRIAGRFGVTLADLIAANAEALPNPDVLQIGDRLIIPAPLPTALPAASEIPAAT